MGADPTMKRDPTLTKRQRQIVRLVARGYPNAEIAQRLGLTTGTVKAHVHTMLLQLNVNNRTALVMAAQRQANA